MHSSMKITDEFYSNLNDGEVQNRIEGLGKEGVSTTQDEAVVNLFREFVKSQKHL